MPGELWPADRAAFAAYFEAYPVSVGDDARAVAHDLLHPRVPRWMRPLVPTLRVVTAGLLPPAVRDAYGLPHDPVRFDRLVRRIRRWYPRLPASIRHAPARRLLRGFRSSSA